MQHLSGILIFLILPLSLTAISFTLSNLEEGCKKIESEKGIFSLILMAPQTGEILFAYHKENIYEKYSPGSLIKPFSYLAAAALHPIENTKSYFCKGFKEYSGNKVCWLSPGHGEINLISAFSHSCNSFFYDEVVKPFLTQPAFLETLKNFQIDFYLKEEGLTDENFYRLAIGLDGFLIASPYSVLRAYNSFFNGGLLLNEKKELIKTIPLPAVEMENIHEGMRGAYLFGTASSVFQNLKIEDFAAKTGTGTAGKGGLITKKTSGWIILFYPSEKPEISLLILSDEGRGGKEAAFIAAEFLKLLNLK